MKPGRMCGVDTERAERGREIKSDFAFVVLSGTGEMISEHQTSEEACTSLARYVFKTREEGAIYKKENGEWFVY